MAFGFIVCKNKRAFLQLAVNAVYILLAVPAGRQYIVVADHQFNLEVCKITAPSFKQFHFEILPAVKKIAHNDESCCFKVLHRIGKPLHIFLKNILGYGNAMLAKMTCFAKMKIGEDERAGFFPKNTPAGGE